MRIVIRRYSDVLVRVQSALAELDVVLDQHKAALAVAKVRGKALGGSRVSRWQMGVMSQRQTGRVRRSAAGSLQAQ